MNKPKKIMIADDDPGILDAISLMLEFEGYQVSTSINGAVLFDKSLELPDLLLLDIWMSGVDGRDVCRQLKQEGRTSRLPIIMVSASQEIGQSALEAGADDFLAKPFDMDELLEKIAKNLNNKMV